VYDYTRITADREERDGDAGFMPGARAAHLRRGHFRLARCGEGRKERRAVWVRPALVGLPGPNVDVARSDYKVVA
jgi:hypothetical protein